MSSSTTTTATNNNNQPKARIAFNFQFKPETRVNNLASLSVSEVAEWLKQINQDILVDIFTKEEVDGLTLRDLTEADLKDLGLTLGQRKSVIRERQLAVDMVVKNIKGVVISKGFLPQGPGLTAEQRELIRNKRYDTATGTYVLRDIPLNDEELSCWVEQSEWLVCPVSGQKWMDEQSIMGVGIYQVPRFIDAKEVQRGVDDELRATQEKQKQARPINTSSDSTTTTTINSNEQFDKTFQVYPSVHPPPPENIDDANRNIEVPLGHIEVIVGPSFDIRAYNWGSTGNENRGILSKKERGVLSIDQQYNAFNFIFYVLRAQNSYERKLCTNRLSFFIDEKHGQRVFPENIESQLSLLVYRDKRACKSSGQQIAESLRLEYLSNAIRKSIPDILIAVVMEVFNGRSSVLPERIDHSIRTYLLIHQVSIKLVLYYPTAYECLYKSVVRWIQNPFSPLCEEEWPSLESVLVGASLVGIPWPMMRESFVKKLMFVMMNQAKSHGTLKQRISHIFYQNQELIHRILYEIGFFFNNSKSLIETDRAYSRCAGSLPKSERDNIKKMISDVEKITKLEEVWIALGMSDPTSAVDEDRLTDLIGSYLGNVSKNISKWQHMELPQTKIDVPPPETRGSATQTMVFRTDIERLKQEELNKERAKHRGYPNIKNRGKLDPKVCQYPECQKRFSCRDHLFKHLRLMIEPDRMIRSYHVDHFKITGAEACIDDGKCPVCPKTFPSRDELELHFVELGVRGFVASKSQLKERKIRPKSMSISRMSKAIFL
eukprot:TRINITY_DN3866_c0_g1_i1.p1 TRINITY_DN3866_c0_g1~~TRINITY_DN3866_c0_g1_i1.p1  ORF type:complete len:774 (-),score=200.90 TRINITY_DN3866_c0_g1_i1:402-2723(-)